MRFAKRLADSGFKISARDYRYRFCELTESGIGKIEESRTDEKQAFFLAVDALKRSDYSGTISAYRNFDNKWGFVHASGITTLYLLIMMFHSVSLIL